MSGEDLTDEDAVVRSLTAFHEGSTSVGSDPAENSPADDPALMERVLRAQACVRLLDRLAAQGNGDVLSKGSLSSIAFASLAARLPDSAQQESGMPARIGRFQIVRELGHGGFGIVLLAIDPTLGREVALKIPRPDSLVNPQLRRRFLREAQAAGTLHHPNLVRVFESGNWGLLCYIAEEYCVGKSLADWLHDRRGAIPLPFAVKLVATLAAAVDYAHRRGVIHRDLKPGNVILDAGGALDAEGTQNSEPLDFVPKIVDFGLAKLLEGAPDETRSSAILGTPAYMAPEQAEGRMSQVGRPTDIYGLGVIFYELLTGRPPYSGATDVETLRRVVTEEPVPPRKLRADVPRNLEAICLKCLEKNPAQRYPSAAALGDDLARFLAGAPTAARPPGSFRRMVRFVRRRRAVAVACTSILIAGLVGLGAGFWYSARLENARAVNERFRIRARAREAQALREGNDTRHFDYVADMVSAFVAWKNSHQAEAAELLERYQPQPGKEDIRTFGWHFLWRLSHPRVRTFQLRDFEPNARASSMTGDQLAAVDPEGVARLWDLDGGRESSTVRGRAGALNVVKFSDDGRLLALAGDDSSALLWNTSPPGPRDTLAGSSGRLRCLAFSADGRTLAAGSDDQSVTVWDTATGHARAHLEGRDGGIRSLAFSPDGRTLATGTDQGFVLLWDVAARRLRVRLSAHHASKIVGCLRFSHDGKSFASASAGEDARVMVWNARTGKRENLLTGHSGPVQSLAFSPDDHALVVALKNGSLWQWSAATGQLLETVQGPVTKLEHAELSPDGGLLRTTSSDGSVNVWEINAPELHKTISGLTVVPSSLALSADGAQVAVAIRQPEAGGLSARIFDAQTGASRESALNQPPDHGLGVFADANRMMVQVPVPSEGIALWLVLNNGRRWIDRTYTLKSVPASGRSAMTCLALARSGRWFATGHLHGDVRLWEFGSCHLRATLSSGEDSDIARVDFSPDATLLASANKAGTIRLWDVETVKERATILRHQKPPLCMTFSPNGAWLVTTSADGMVRVWKTATGTQAAILQGQAKKVRAITFSPDGKTLVSGNEDGTIVFWDVRTFHQILSLEAHSGGVQSLAFSADGRTLASGGATAKGLGEIAVWPTASLF